MAKEVVVLSGVPGSGKSTRAKQVYPTATVCSADTFFTDSNGVYNFNPSKLNEAHATCVYQFVEAVLRGHPLIVVDNTNLSIAEVAPYMAVAAAYGYKARIEAIDTPWDVAAKRNIHNVPKNKVKQMSDRMARAYVSFPPWWTRVVVTP